MSRRAFAPRSWAALLSLALLAAGRASAAEEPLGRLFYTPEQRRQLDRSRSLGSSRPGLEEAAPALRLDGVLRHPDGRLTTWLNGQPVEAGRGAAGRAPGEARVVTRSGKSVTLRVGEALPQEDAPPEDLLGDGHARRESSRR